MSRHSFEGEHIVSRKYLMGIFLYPREKREKKETHIPRKGKFIELRCKVAIDWTISRIDNTREKNVGQR